MAKVQSQSLRNALALFGPRLQHLLKKADLSQPELERELKKRGQPVATKTINNLVNKRHSAQLGNLAAIADYFGVPLWTMLLPGLHPELLEEKGLVRLDKLMQDYLGCDDDGRRHTENVAAAHTKRKVK